MNQYRLPWTVYRFNANIRTGITDKRYGRVPCIVDKPWILPIRRLMAAQGLTQGELAKKAKIRPNTLSEAMNGRSPRMDTLECVAAALNVPLYELFVSEEQSSLLKQAAQSHQNLVRQEELATLVIRQLAPQVAQAVAAAVSGTPAPQQAIANISASEEHPPAEHLARGGLRRSRKTA
jgi:transcriptional regulator with XRE-family HTH domain